MPKASNIPEPPPMKPPKKYDLGHLESGRVRCFRTEVLERLDTLENKLMNLNINSHPIREIFFENTGQIISFTGAPYICNEVTICKDVCLSAEDIPDNTKFKIVFCAATLGDGPEELEFTTEKERDEEYKKILKSLDIPIVC